MAINVFEMESNQEYLYLGSVGSRLSVCNFHFNVYLTDMVMTTYMLCCVYLTVFLYVLSVVFGGCGSAAFPALSI